MTDNFDDFFADDDFDLDEPEFPADDFDDLPDIELEESSASRPFILIASLLAVVFVILVAVAVAIIISSSGGCDERCLEVTSISGTNFAIETSVAASETARSIAETTTATAEIALQATQTFDAAIEATGTRGAENTAIAATSTQQSIQATETQSREFMARTEVVLSMTPPATDTPTPEPATSTPTPTEDGGDTTGGNDTTLQNGQGGAGATIEGELRDSINQAVAGATICIFRDDGDGVFNPGAGSAGDCAPAQLVTGGQAATVEPTDEAPPVITDEATDDQTDLPLNPIFQTATANAGGAGSTTGGGTTGGDTTGGADTTDTTGGADTTGGDTGGAPNAGPTLNPIFQTATANAGGAGSTTGGDTSGGDTAGGVIPTPTVETLGANIDPKEPASLGRVVPEPVAEALPQQQGDDEFVDEIITDGNGRFVIPALPEGTYWIKIADQTIGVTVTTEAQELLIPREDGGNFVISVPAAVGGGTLTPTPETLVNPIDQTSTAAAAGSQVSSPTPETELPTTGFFTSDDGEVPTVWFLVILAGAGLLLMGIVLAARRMRTLA